MGNLVSFRGSAEAGPSSIAVPGTRTFDSVPLDASVPVSLSSRTRVRVLAAMTVTVTFNTMVTVKAVAVRTTAPVRVQLTSPAGADQTYPVSKTAHVVNENEPFTGMKIVGGTADADVEILLGGEPT